jgi:hypothetical protein
MRTPIYGLPRRLIKSPEPDQVHCSCPSLKPQQRSVHHQSTKVSMLKRMQMWSGATRRTVLWYHWLKGSSPDTPPRPPGKRRLFNRHVHLIIMKHTGAFRVHKSIPTVAHRSPNRSWLVPTRPSLATSRCTCFDSVTGSQLSNAMASPLRTMHCDWPAGRITCDSIGCSQCFGLVVPSRPQL